jgi:hypothetical protein
MDRARRLSISTVEDLRKVVISVGIQGNEDLMDVEIAPIPIAVMQSFGQSFCGVPPEEITQDMMISSKQLRTRKPQHLYRRRRDWCRHQ